MEFNCAKHHKPYCKPCEAEWQAKQDAEREKNWPTKIVDLETLNPGRLRRFAGEIHQGRDQVDFKIKRRT